jgi:class 3 adenylate cyclase
LFPAKVSIALAAGELEAALDAATALEKLAAELDTPAPLAATAQSHGEIELACAKPEQAADHFRRAWRLWCEIEAPYDAARSQALLAEASAGMGDLGGAILQLKAAQATFKRIGAVQEARRAAGRLTVLQSQRERASRSAQATQQSHKTFMFTDIVDSTKLVEVLGDDAWDTLLQWHNRTVRACFERNDGEEVGSEGDGFFVAFNDAASAIACAIEIQRALADHRVDHGFAPQMRIGLHTAEALKRGDDYAGKGVHVAARIAAAGGAGDIVASVETIEGAGSEMPASDAYDIELKGLSGTVAVATIVWGRD